MMINPGTMEEGKLLRQSHQGQQLIHNCQTLNCHIRFLVRALLSASLPYHSTNHISGQELW